MPHDFVDHRFANGGSVVGVGLIGWRDDAIAGQHFRDECARRQRLHSLHQIRRYSGAERADAMTGVAGRVKHPPTQVSAVVDHAVDDSVLAGYSRLNQRANHDAQQGNQ